MLKIIQLILEEVKKYLLGREQKEFREKLLSDIKQS